MILRYRLCIKLRRYWTVVNHAVAWFTQPNQIGHFIDSIKWKLVFNVVTMLLEATG